MAVESNLTQRRKQAAFGDVDTILCVSGGHSVTVNVCVCASKTQNYQEGLRYIGRLPFEQAESTMKHYGKTLMHHVPEGTTLLLKGLCTNYHPSGDAVAERDSPERSRVNKVSLQCCCSDCARD